MTGHLPTASRPDTTRRIGSLILNADDWGRDKQTTDRILDCAVLGTLSSASAMVFMEDSDRAAAIARDRAIDTGLHLNLTTRFSAPGCSPKLVRHQEEVAACLRRNRMAPALLHPWLKRSLEYLVSSQIDEYARLYGGVPKRIDGHHHMHLCTDMLAGGLLPPGGIVRRSFTFARGEKSWANRLYRQTVDRILVRRHSLTDLFFSIAPLDTGASYTLRISPGNGPSRSRHTRRIRKSIGSWSAASLHASSRIFRLPRASHCKPRARPAS